jgi:transcriptional regulator with XRE-family HTH domain
MTSPEKLVSFRHRMNWTQRLCARYLGVDQATWANWEAGRGGPSARNAHTVRQMLALAETDEGRASLAEWAREANAQRAARRRGQKERPKNTPPAEVDVRKSDGDIR